MIEVIKTEVERLLTEECERGINKHGSFSSEHEGYAVILEEVQETEQELEEIKRHLNFAWQYIKQDNSKASLELVNLIKKKAIFAACEAIQIAAMGEKFIQSFDPSLAIPIEEIKIPF